MKKLSKNQRAVLGYLFLTPKEYIPARTVGEALDGIKGIGHVSRVSAYLALTQLQADGLVSAVWIQNPYQAKAFRITFVGYAMVALNLDPTARPP